MELICTSPTTNKTGFCFTLFLINLFAIVQCSCFIMLGFLLSYCSLSVGLYDYVSHLESRTFSYFDTKQARVQFFHGID